MSGNPCAFAEDGKHIMSNGSPISRDDGSLEIFFHCVNGSCPLETRVSVSKEEIERQKREGV